MACQGPENDLSGERGGGPSGGGSLEQLILLIRKVQHHPVASPLFGRKGLPAAPMPPIALYARVSTAEQSCEAQLHALRSYATARGWRRWNTSTRG